MKKYRLTLLNGSKATFSTDDTFTLQLHGPSGETTETTPEDLREMLSHRTMLRLLNKSTEQSERSKLARALELPNADQY